MPSTEVNKKNAPTPRDVSLLKKEKRKTGVVVD